MSSLWTDLVRTYATTAIQFPDLKVATLAQWALESGWGSSRLAQDHFNFGGLKFRARINAGREDRPLAVPVDYEAHDGVDTYCKFASLEDFIAGYWAFIRNGSMYDGWQAFGSDPSGYIGHLVRGGYAADQDYLAKVIGLFPRIREQVRELGVGTAFGVEADHPTTARAARAAILIGHNRNAQGAFSEHLQVSEWRFNQRVAHVMLTAAAEFNLEARMFFREPNTGGYAAEIATAYAAIDAWAPNAILELHFNAGGGTGTEMLHWRDSPAGKRLADAVQAPVVDELGLRSRGSRGRGAGERGSTSLRASRIPTILAEPFFGDSAGDCDRILRLGEAPLARAYLIGVRDAVTAIA